MTRNRFKLLFQDKHNQILDLEYTLNDSVVADKWFRQIKHLKHVPIDEVESDLVDLSDIWQIHKEFCEFAGLKHNELPDVISRTQLNEMHQLYEDLHDTLSRKKDNSAMYKFHRAIHFYEYKQLDANHRAPGHISWGVKGGPLEEKFNCNPYYEEEIIKGNLYLPWAELGKTPVDYFNDEEPSEQTRFNQLAKPHVTLRSRFFVAKANFKPKSLDPDFIEWFNVYKEGWLDHHNIPKWDHIDEKSAPLLAIAGHTHGITDEKFVRIEL